MITKEPESSRRAAGRHAAPDEGPLASLPSATRSFAAAAAASTHPVLLNGETGSGKSHLARLIHDAGPRRGRPFVPVNCGAIPRELFEREMFGHARGAFTGATDSQPGLFEAASGGTLFLDEIGELPLELQPKLLRALDDGAVRRLGSTREVAVDVRIIAASNRDLRALVESGCFREDLFYRCCVLEHRVPSLRERRNEIPGIARDLLARCTRGCSTPHELSDEAMELICSYPWYGNIRELDNCLCHATVFAKGRTIEVFELPERLRAPEPAPSGGTGHRGSPRPRYAASVGPAEEREVIVDALRAAHGNRTRAARRLGMSRSTLWAKMKLHGIA